MGKRIYVRSSGTWVDVTTPSGSDADITEVVAGDGLTGGSASGSATLDVVGGNGITVTANAVEVDTNTIATKAYVDAFSSQMNWHGAANYATTAALPNSPAYANGTAGVGATLTATTYGALVVDGHTFTLEEAEDGYRVLVKDQVNEVHNGIYVVTAQ